MNSGWLQSGSFSLFVISGSSSAFEMFIQFLLLKLKNINQLDLISSSHQSFQQTVNVNFHEHIINVEKKDQKL